MFSVKAAPFNSRARQLYGGWTLAQAGGNPWLEKVYHEMAGKYAPDAIKRQSRQWLRQHKANVRANPALRDQIYRAGLPYWRDAIRPPLVQQAKDAIWNEFLNNTPVPNTRDLRIKTAFLRHAPYPNAQIINTNNAVGVPAMNQIPGLAAVPWNSLEQYYRDLAELLPRRPRGAPRARGPRGNRPQVVPAVVVPAAAAPAAAPAAAVVVPAAAPAAAPAVVVPAPAAAAPAVAPLSPSAIAPIVVPDVDMDASLPDSFGSVFSSSNDNNAFHRSAASYSPRRGLFGSDSE